MNEKRERERRALENYDMLVRTGPRANARLLKHYIDKGYVLSARLEYARRTVRRLRDKALEVAK